MVDVGPPRRGIDGEPQGQVGAPRRRPNPSSETTSSERGHDVSAGSNGASRRRPSTPIHTPTLYDVSSSRRAGPPRKIAWRIDAAATQRACRDHIALDADEGHPDPSHGARQGAARGEMSGTGETQRIAGGDSGQFGDQGQRRRAGQSGSTQRPAGGGETPHAEGPWAHPHGSDGVAVQRRQGGRRFPVRASLGHQLAPGPAGLVVDDHRRLVAAAPACGGQPPHGVDIFTAAQ